MNSIKLLVFPYYTIISKIRYTAPDELGGPDLIMDDPFIVTHTDGNYFLTPYLLEFTANCSFHIHSDKLITMAEPKQSLLQKYENLWQHT